MVYNVIDTYYKLLNWVEWLAHLYHKNSFSIKCVLFKSEIKWNDNVYIFKSAMTLLPRRFSDVGYLTKTMIYHLMFCQNSFEGYLSFKISVKFQTLEKLHFCHPRNWEIQLSVICQQLALGNKNEGITMEFLLRNYKILFVWAHQS